LVEDREWIERIRWFESRPRFQTFHETWQQFQFDKLAPIVPPSEEAPTVCVIDSGVSSGNPFLRPVTKDDLLRSYLHLKPTNPSDECGHGSAVASLASYYALNLAEGAQNVGKVWIASARILNEDNALEDERLFSRLLRDVVVDFAPVGVKVFCLAVGDDSKPWTRAARAVLPRKSWVARTIDQLSREFDVVFVTCTGNISLPDLLEVVPDAQSYPTYFDADNLQILDPGQAALAITVGSIAGGTQIVQAHHSPIAQPNQPSPFTRRGPGIRGEIKPELVEYGGNLAFDSQMNRVAENAGLNVVAATRQLTPAARHTFGTSFAAPRVAHRLSLIYQDLQTLNLENVSACLLRAFLIGSARYPDRLDEFRTLIEGMSAGRWFDLYGYGIPSELRATLIDDYSSIMFFQGEVEPDQVQFFDVPVPSELSNSSSRKRLTVTVAHAPEVQRWGLERYLGVDVKWRMFRGNISRDEIVAAMSEDVTQSDEEEIDELDESDLNELSSPSELKFKLGINRRSRGTVQHDWCEWSRHRQEFSDGHYTLAVAAYHRWQRKVVATPLGIVIRLEDLGRTVPVYTLVETLLAQIEAQVQSRR
jgi:hypothetical protein